MIPYLAPLLTLAVTGHRPPKIGGYDRSNPLRQRIIDELKWSLSLLKPTRVITGMALGVDQDMALLCVEYKIPFIAAIPCAGQEKMWPAESKKAYWRLLELAQTIIECSSLNYHPSLMQRRNEWMVNNSNVLVAVYDGSDGGTANCYKYAMSAGREIHRIDPRDLKT